MGIAAVVPDTRLGTRCKDARLITLSAASLRWSFMFVAACRRRSSMTPIGLALAQTLLMTSRAQPRRGQLWQQARPLRTARRILLISYMY